jgi:hypothetical protein
MHHFTRAAAGPLRARIEVLTRNTLVFCLLGALPAIGFSQTQGLVTRPPVAHIQGPRIGLIQFYGLHKTTEAKLRQALGVHEGDFLPRSKGDAEERIDNLPGIVESHLEAVCCDGGNTILFVGIEEKGATHFDLREPPDGEVQLPEEVTTLYRRFLEASAKAARAGITGEDLTHGHALSADLATRDLQEQFVPVTKQYLAEIRSVLRNASDEEQRAMAAYAIGYAPDKRDIIDDLQYALKDADAGVRNNATRGLKALAVLARLNPDSGVKVEATWFIEMLNSLSFTDRNQALGMLQILTESSGPSGRNASAIAQMRDRSLGALVEMARWKSLTYALPAFVLVGRLTDLTDTQVQDAWERGDRESVIAKATAKAKK